MTSNDFMLTAVYVEMSEGAYSAYIEEIPGVNSQGETLEEAKSNLREAFQLVLETNRILTQRNLKKGTKLHREPLTLAL